MKYIINKKLILEDYFQDMVDGLDHDTSVDKNGEGVKSFVKNENLLDKSVEQKGSRFLKTKYDLFDDPNHVSLRMISQNAKDAHIDMDRATDNAHKFLKTVGHIENDNHVHGTNHVKGSTIEGLYQTSEPQAQTARTRFFKHYKLDAVAPYMTKEEHIPVKDMDKIQQTTMTVAGLSKHGNSINNLNHFNKMLDGDKQAATDMYYTDHHTNPDKKTYSRASKIFNNMKLNRG